MSTRYPKILFFTTADDARSLGVVYGPGVQYRNPRFADMSDFPEAADYVAGEVPERYKGYPAAIPYNEWVERKLNPEQFPAAPPVGTVPPPPGDPTAVPPPPRPPGWEPPPAGRVAHGEKPK